MIDNVYGEKPLNLKVPAGGRAQGIITLGKSHNWYDISIQTEKSITIRRYAGHVETGNESTTDPFMGRLNA